MARSSKHFIFTGPFHGINTNATDPLYASIDDPRWFFSASNVETFDGQIRPRTGFTKYSDGAVNQPTAALQNMFSVKTLTTRAYDDLIVLTDESTPVFWRRVFTDSAGTIDWAKVSYTFAPTTGRKGMYIAGNRAYFFTGKGAATGDYLWCFERETIAGIARSGGFEAAEASGTVATTVGATTTTVALQVVAGTQSQDNTYTFQNCEITITGGTGAGQTRQVSAYDHTGGAMERLITVSQAWTTNPDTTSTYSIYRMWFRKAGLTAPSASDFTITSANSTGTLTPTNTYSYKMTYYDSHTGLESNGSDEKTITLGAADDTVTLKFTADANMPTTIYGNTGHAASAVGLAADKIRYYRKNTTDGETDWTYLYEAYIDASTTAVTSQLVDTNAARQVATVPVTHGTPPLGGYGAYHKGRAFLTDYRAAGINYSEPDDPIYGLGAEYFYQPSFLLQTVEPITWLQSAGDELLAFQERRIYRCETSNLPNDPFVSQIIGAEGTDNGFSVAVAAGGLAPGTSIYYTNILSTYKYDGATSRKIGLSTGLSGVDATSFPNATGVYDPNYDRYIIFYDVSSASTSFFYAQVYNARTGGWDIWQLPTSSTATSVRSMTLGYTLTGRLNLFLGFGNGRVGYWSNPHTSEVFTDNGTNITYSFNTPYLILGNPVARKHIHEVAWMIGSTTSTSTTLSCGVDPFTAATLATATFSSISTGTPISNQHIALAVGADAQSIRIKVNGTSGAFQSFRGFVVTYSEVGQRF